MNLRLLFALVTLTAPLLRATSVVPPNFSELVDEADAIYRGHVTDVQSRRVAAPDGGGVIKTFITVAVERVIKGSEVAETKLEFLGGTVGDETLEVGGMPHFAVGDRGIVFVQNNGTQFCPLVRMTHGRYRIERHQATGTDYIARDNRAPLKDVEDVARPMNDGPTAAAARTDSSGALSPEAFEARLDAQVRRSHPHFQTN